MSKIMVPQYVDDLTGERLGENGTTIAFSFQGQSYEIDLSPDNATKMTNALGQYIDHARKASTGSGRRKGSGLSGLSSDSAHKEETRAARAWLVEQGIIKPEARGRISAENMERYRSRGQQTMPAAEPAAEQSGGDGNSSRRSRKQAKEESPEPVPA